MLHMKDKKLIKIDNSSNRRRKSIEDEEKELEELLDTNENEDESEGGPKEVNKSDKRTDWEKRYKDLQSYHSKKENELLGRVKDLETKLSEQEEKVEYPKTEEEFQEWAKKYPESVAFIETMILRHSKKTDQSLKDKMKELEEEKVALARDRAYSQLMSLHPDFEDIQEQFAEWLEDQPVALQKTIVEPSYDDEGVRAASRTIEIFKTETGIKNKKEKASDPKAAAAKVKSTSSGNPAEDHSGKPTFRESEIARMSDREFEAKQDEILEAQRSGRFIYDLSGGAR